MKIKDYLTTEIPPTSNEFNYILEALFQQKGIKEDLTNYEVIVKGSFDKDMDKLFEQDNFFKENPFKLVYSEEKKGEHKFTYMNEDAFISGYNYTTKTEEYYYINGFNKEYIDKIVSFIKSHKKEKTEGTSTYYILVQTENGIETHTIDVGNSILIEDNYTPEAVIKFKKLIEDLQSDKPSGRLGILQGDPGTGKSYFIKALANICKDIPILLISRSFISESNTPQLVSSIMSIKEGNEPILIIIEDADDCLLPRASDNMHSIHSLLNLTDGIMGAALDIRIIVTTNAKKIEIDPALLRPGRLSQRIDVNALPYEQALKILRRLKNDNTAEFSRYAKEYTLAEIYQYSKENQ